MSSFPSNPNNHYTSYRVWNNSGSGHSGSGNHNNHQTVNSNRHLTNNNIFSTQQQPRSVPNENTTEFEERILYTRSQVVRYLPLFNPSTSQNNNDDNMNDIGFLNPLHNSHNNNDNDNNNSNNQMGYDLSARFVYDTNENIINGWNNADSIFGNDSCKLLFDKYNSKNNNANTIETTGRPIATSSKTSHNNVNETELEPAPRTIVNLSCVINQSIDRSYYVAHNSGSGHSGSGNNSSHDNCCNNSNIKGSNMNSRLKDPASINHNYGSIMLADDRVTEQDALLSVHSDDKDVKGCNKRSCWSSSSSDNNNSNGVKLWITLFVILLLLAGCGVGYYFMFGFNPFWSISSNNHSNNKTGNNNENIKDNVISNEVLLNKVNNHYSRLVAMEHKTNTYSSKYDAKEGSSCSSLAQSINDETELITNEFNRYYSDSQNDYLITVYSDEVDIAGNDYVTDGNVGYLWSGELYGVTQPLYRYINEDCNGNDHFYSIKLADYGTSNWQQIAGFIMTQECSFNTALYEYYSETTCNHYYTINKNEGDNLDGGFEYKGIIGYVVKE